MLIRAHAEENGGVLPAHVRPPAEDEATKKEPFKTIHFADQRAVLQHQVFQPGHRLPTMSVEEWAEREMAQGNFLSGGGEAGVRVLDALFVVALLVVALLGVVRAFMGSSWAAFTVSDRGPSKRPSVKPRSTGRRTRTRTARRKSSARATSSTIRTSAAAATRTTAADERTRKGPTV